MREEGEVEEERGLEPENIWHAEICTSVLPSRSQKNSSKDRALTRESGGKTNAGREKRMKGLTRDRKRAIVPRGAILSERNFLSIRRTFGVEKK